VGAEPTSWTIHHFSLSNPKGRDQDDVPKLLRRVAAQLEAEGAVEVQDIVFHSEVAKGKEWPSMTVYFHAED
jgi:hypothetical protein